VFVLPHRELRVPLPVSGARRRRYWVSTAN
jgi:hypothetical protein